MAALRPTALPRSVTRAFSTSAPTLARRIPPESPLYINVLNPPQDQSIESKRELKPVRGHLPIPRKVFRWKRGEYSPTQDVLDSLAAEPTSESSKQPARSDKQAWKRAMATSRRENVRSGIVDLWERKVVSDRQLAQSRARKIAEHKKAAIAPESEADRLTRATVDAETLKTAVVQDPLRFERQKESLARSEALEKERSERRIDAVQELYMNARSFIVTEKELESAVEKEFAADLFTSSGRTASGRPVYNIWDYLGQPKSMSEMMRDISGNTNDLLRSTTKDATRTLKRQKMVAEQLTGGQMD